MKTVTVLLGVFWAGFTFANVINVPGDQSTIQAGINTATDGDTVLVAENTFYENINFKGKAITVASHFILDQDTSHISRTIIDGSQPSHPDSGSVLIFQSEEDTTSVLCGFTITGGTGTQVLPEIRVGGAIMCGYSGAKIVQNIILDNSVISINDVQGGAISSGPPGNSSHVILRSNVIKNNTASGKTGAWGGAVYLNSSGRIENNNIHHNLVTSSSGYAVGGGIHAGTEFSGKLFIVRNNVIMQNTSESTFGANGYAGGIFVGGSLYAAQIVNNIVSKNYSSHKGGGLCCYYGTKAQISENTISWNVAGLQGGGIEINDSSPEILNNRIIENSTPYSGGGIGCYGKSTPEIVNNLIAFNEAGNDAGGIDFYDHSDAVVINNTIVENSALWGGAITAYGSSNPVFMNTILYGNRADSSGNQVVIGDDTSDPTFTYCNIEGGSEDFGFYNDSHTYTGTYKHNMDSDPQFVTGDSLYHLLGNSPCIDTGNPETTGLSLPETDIFGNPRIHDGNGDNTHIIDIGAHEFFLVDIEFYNQVKLDQYFLFQNYPNPFNPKTTISYQLPVTSKIELIIYNVLGQEVEMLVSQKQPTGQYQVEWDSNDFTSGVYFYSLKTDKGIVKTRKMIVLR